MNNIFELLDKKDVDCVLIPSNDEFFGEYVRDENNRLLRVTNFSGSNGTALLSKNEKLFFTDGRYLEQAAKQISSDFKVIDIANDGFNKSIRGSGLKKIGLISELFSFSYKKNLLKSIRSDQSVIDIPLGLFDKEIGTIPNHLSSTIHIDQSCFGKSSEEKIINIVNQLKEDECILVSDSASVNWILNIRGNSMNHCGILNCNAIFYKNGSHDIFTDPRKIDLKCIKKNGVRKVILNDSKISISLYNLILSENLEVQHVPYLIESEKCIKNEIEISGMKEANLFDSVAVTKFIFWLKNQDLDNSDISEISAAEKLATIRRSNQCFLEESFPTISAFNQNGAIIHYRATENTNQRIKSNGVYLIDSGGHYRTYGTSDITRTISTGSVSESIKRNYTLVLKGHISVASTAFLDGTTGNIIDSMAREHLLKNGLDYQHGTGHGVGHYLSVHEGPCSISKISKYEIKSGMILSNEPGYYLANEYGIRLENLVLVKKDSLNQGVNYFETINYVPFDPDMIDFSLLEEHEVTWLRRYHQSILDKIGNMVLPDELEWLKKILNRFNR